MTSCLFAAVAGIFSYFGAAGPFFVVEGRAAGVFADPNVLGSFLVLGALFLMHGLLTGRSRRPWLAFPCLCLILAAIFLSFSRGSWGALVLGSTLMVVLTFNSNPGHIRRRIMASAIIAAGFATVLFAGLMTVGDVSERFSSRAQLTQDYDEGVTGRFGNQIRSLPMLLERPAGFGPIRFRLTFGLDPHNSYIGGFANGGWVGGLAFIGLVLVSTFVGFRLCLTPSPFQRQAQIVFPALLMFFLQAFQIDIDHWRHVYIMLGMVWGLEAGRARWAAALAQPVPPPLAARGLSPQPA
jgi:O-antigen ligase